MPLDDPQVGEVWQIRSPDNLSQAVITSVEYDRLYFEGRRGAPQSMSLRSFVLSWEFVQAADWTWKCHVKGCAYPAWFRVALSPEQIVKVCAGHRPWNTQVWLPSEDLPNRAPPERILQVSLEDLEWMPKPREKWWKVTGKKLEAPVLVLGVDRDSEQRRTVQYQTVDEKRHNLPLEGFWKHYAREKPEPPKFEVGAEYTDGKGAYLIGLKYDIQGRRVFLEDLDHKRTVSASFESFPSKYKRLVRKTVWDRLLDESSDQDPSLPGVS